MLFYRLFWLLMVFCAVETSLSQGESLCFAEELPIGVKFQGSYGAKSPVEFPISITISSPVGILYRADDIPELARFSFSVSTSGVYKLCFIGQVRHDGKKSRDILVNLDVGSVPSSTGTAEGDMSKLAFIESVLTDMKEVREDFRHMKHRELYLRSNIRKLGTSTVFISIVCIMICWVGMILIGQWTRVSVRKHM